MVVDQLFRAGRLREAIQALGAEVRDHPTDTRRRTFLFELLCFAGEFDRAGKQVSVLSQANADAAVGALLYRSALAAERQRGLLFEKNEYPKQPAKTVAGTLNGKPFETLEDADPRIGSRLEVFVAGEYVWLPFEHIGSVRIGPPKLLRDLMWATARVTTSPNFKGQDFGEVLLPVLCPFSWKSPSDEVKLGRSTDWQDLNGVAVPVGQKMLIVDGEEGISFLEIRELNFTAQPD
ncbi:MAG: virulence protein SciE type [Acidobacteriota bacterium]|nr:virulence protein SciE type [Acidobacteriota bacterium]